MDYLDIITYKIALETSRLLDYKQEELEIIEWSKGESNIDLYFSELACKVCLEAWEIVKKENNLMNIYLECKTPDINLFFIDNNKNVLKSKIELKSSKKKIILGSTINKLDINQPLIFCLRPSKKNQKYEFRCSQYYKAMGKTGIDLFQDRTPRPHINYDKMINNNFQKIEKDDWVKYYSKCALTRLENNINKSWQDNLINDIKKRIIKSFIKDTSVEQFIKLKNNI